LLPDILTIDVASPAGFLNGRKPADDVIDAELGLITEGFVTTDCVGSNDKAFPSTFPYLAAPHPTHQLQSTKQSPSRGRQTALGSALQFAGLKHLPALPAHAPRSATAA
jgi:hypothetical protein